MNRLSKVRIEWSPNFAYAVGLITTDGCLSKDHRHINFTSQDESLVRILKKCLGIENKISRKNRGKGLDKKYFYVQFGDKNFYEFLNSIGLTSAKSKTIGILAIPSTYFVDFLRGCIDGDGCISIFSHPESCHPQLRLKLASASFQFLVWIKSEIGRRVLVDGGIIKKGNRIFELCYGKSDSIKLLKFLYYKDDLPFLERKYLQARPFLDTILRQIDSLSYFGGLKLQQ